MSQIDHEEASRRGNRIDHTGRVRQEVNGEGLSVYRMQVCGTFWFDSYRENGSSLVVSHGETSWCECMYYLDGEQGALSGHKQDTNTFSRFHSFFRKVRCSIGSSASSFPFVIIIGQRDNWYYLRWHPSLCRLTYYKSLLWNNRWWNSFWIYVFFLSHPFCPLPLWYLRTRKRDNETTNILTNQKPLNKLRKAMHLH